MSKRPNRRCHRHPRFTRKKETAVSDRERLIEAITVELHDMPLLEDYNYATVQEIATAALDAAMPILGEVSEGMEAAGYNADVDHGDGRIGDWLSAIYTAMLKEKLG